MPTAPLTPVHFPTCLTVQCRSWTGRTVSLQAALCHAAHIRSCRLRVVSCIRMSFPSAQLLAAQGQFKDSFAATPPGPCIHPFLMSCPSADGERWGGSGCGIVAYTVSKMCVGQGASEGRKCYGRSWLGCVWSQRSARHGIACLVLVHFAHHLLTLGKKDDKEAPAALQTPRPAPAPPCGVARSGAAVTPCPCRPSSAHTKISCCLPTCACRVARPGAAVAQRP